jgi:hypothetical protein
MISPLRHCLSAVLCCLAAAACGGDVGDSDLRDAGGPDTGSQQAVCESGILCGDPAICCADGKECVEGTCLAICASGTRCGASRETCCAGGEVCLDAACVAPGPECSDSYDCMQPGEFCEPTLGRCLPQPETLVCEVRPQFTALEVTVEHSNQTREIIAIPLVADLTGDGVSEVVVNYTRTDGGSWHSGNIGILDGRDVSQELLFIPHAPASGTYGSHGRSTPALGDVSGDGRPDIVYAARPVNENDAVLIIAVDASGGLLWKSHGTGGGDYKIKINNGAVTLANLDGDPRAEVIIGAAVLDDDGLVVWDQGGSGNGGFVGSNDGYNGGISAVADLNGDELPEIISGNAAWNVSWTAGTPPAVTLSALWPDPFAGPDGYPAVADFDGDGTPEVVVVGQGTVHILDGLTGQLWCGIDPSGAACDGNDALRTQPLAIPGGASNNRGGPPTIADFDGDGRVEIGVAGGHAYTVYDVNRPGEEVVQHVDNPVSPASGALFIRWSKATQDESSNATGSSVFDFQGDGAAEVVYADECHLRVYSGPDGTLQLELPSTSATIHEYPLVVDVDTDGNSEILVVANSAHSQNDCGAGHPARNGLYVYGDASDEWVPTRKVWPQHTYHVTNATSDGNVPVHEEDNWTRPGLNNYRQNVQGEGVFNAPDLTLDISVGLEACNDSNQLTLRARVANAGALGVPAGVPVRFYEGTDATGRLLGSVTTSTAILPGNSVTLSLLIPAPPEPTSYFAEVDGAAGGGVVIECNEANNGDLTTMSGCQVTGIE